MSLFKTICDNEDLQEGRKYMHSVTVLLHWLLLPLDFQFVNANFSCRLINKVKWAGPANGGRSCLMFLGYNTPQLGIPFFV
jgi:hypothetical protein